jgi:hypothetical protein
MKPIKETQKPKQPKQPKPGNYTAIDRFGNCFKLFIKPINKIK